MIHLLFLLASLGLVIAGQKLALFTLNRVTGWTLRRWVQILVMAMPVSILVLFSLTMVPAILVGESDHSTNAQMHRDWLISLAGVAVFVAPILLALLYNFMRLAWLYLRAERNTWQAPTGLEDLLKGSSATAQVRLWNSPRSFAFNLPGLWPGAKARVILSTGMVAELDQEELRAVLWHESAHLAHRDFYLIWLASWWRLGFFYLPVSGRIFNLLKKEQELACDERVARLGGQPLALALADALLKAWEQTLLLAETNTKKSFGFTAPGLLAERPAEEDFTEQRVNRLLELELGLEPESSRNGFKPARSIQHRFRITGVLGGSTFLWLSILEIMHLIMLPMGCAFTFGVF